MKLTAVLVATAALAGQAVRWPARTKCRVGTSEAQAAGRPRPAVRTPRLARAAAPSGAAHRRLRALAARPHRASACSARLATPGVQQCEVVERSAARRRPRGWLCTLWWAGCARRAGPAAPSGLCASAGHLRRALAVLPYTLTASPLAPTERAQAAPGPQDAAGHRHHRRAQPGCVARGRGATRGVCALRFLIRGPRSRRRQAVPLRRVAADAARSGTRCHGKRLKRPSP